MIVSVLKIIFVMSRNMAAKVGLYAVWEIGGLENEA
jgi:hypothetical protein